MLHINDQDKYGSEDRATEFDGQWTDFSNSYFYYAPQFKKDCFQKLNELQSLQSGWDSDAAPPINRQVLATVRDFIDYLPDHIAPCPMIVPLSSGSVQLEWHYGRRVLELEFESPETVHYLKWDPEHWIEEEDVVSTAENPVLVSLIRWFMEGMLDE